MVLSTVAAVASAALFAVTTNLQRQAASSVPTAHGGPLHLVRRLVADRRWLLAGGIGAVALALHALALALGSVLVVQSVMALGLVIALSIEATREHRVLTGRETTGALLVVGGVVTVVAICSQHGPTTVGPVLTLLSAGVVGATAALLLHTRRGAAGRWQARALAASAGACFAVDAVFLQRAAQTAGLPTAWTVVNAAGFLAASFVGGVAVHRAYQVAPLRSVQPALASAEPLTAFVIGVLALQQGVRGGPLGYAVLVAGLALITAGIMVGLGGSREVAEPVAAPSLPVARLHPEPAVTPVGAARDAELLRAG